MKTFLLNWWERVRESYWAVPAVMAICAWILSHAAISADRYFQESDLELPEWMYRGGADGARVLLSTIVTAMMGVTGVVFSIAVVVLTLASNQFGPHLIRNFIRDRGNQFTLGTFIATFIYALLILRMVYEQEDTNFVPSTGITIALILTLLSTAVLIYFIHHIATKIQAEVVIADVSHELNDTIDRLSKKKQEPSTLDLPDGFEGTSAIVTSDEGNYIAVLDTSTALKIAAKADIIIRFDVRPGMFLPTGGTIASVWPAEKLDDELAECIRDTCILEARRTPQQDVEYGILQLAQIAVRALSPSQNDPFTAIACIDRLGSAIRRLATETMDVSHLNDSEGKLRVVLQTSDFEGHLNAAFDQVRQNAGSSVAVLARLMESLAMVAEKTAAAEQREAVRKQALMVLHESERNIPEEADLLAVKERYDRVLLILIKGSGQA